MTTGLVCGTEFAPNRRGRPRVYCSVHCRRTVEAARVTAELLPPWVDHFRAFAEEAKGLPWYDARRKNAERYAQQAADAIELTTRADAVTRTNR